MAVPQVAIGLALVGAEAALVRPETELFRTEAELVRTKKPDVVGVARSWG